MKTKIKKTLSFDDVLLRPRYSKIKSREDIKINSSLDKFNYFNLPIISSPMDTVTEDAMAQAMSGRGALGIIHRYNSIADQASLVEKAIGSEDRCVGAAIGASGDFLERAQALVTAGARVICVDIAHGHHEIMRTALQDLRSNLSSEVHIMAGNVATIEGYEDLVSWGADSVRVGIGGGSICSTRIQTGHGIPTLQSVLECSKSIFVDHHPIIADGGIKNSGDAVKALAAGAHFVMVGSLLAGTTESPGEVLSRPNGDLLKVYRGMASREAQAGWRSTVRSVEGVSAVVPYKGSVAGVLDSLDINIRSGLSYSGATNLRELREYSEMLSVTASGVVENSTHINNL